MSTSKAIQTALAAQYAAITLPAPFSATATAYTTEKAAMDALASGSDTAPFYVIHRAPTQAITQLAEGRYQVTRAYYARLYTALIGDDNPTAIETLMQQAADCIEPIEDYFMFSADTGDALAAVNVLDNVINRDSEAVELSIENHKYAGVSFEHFVTYLRIKR